MSNGKLKVYKIHNLFVVAETMEEAQEAVKDQLPESYFSEGICPVDVLAPSLATIRHNVVCPECENMFSVILSKSQKGSSK